MARDLSAYLEDIYDACVAIEEVTEAVSLQEYRTQRAVRSSVEREFIIIGEALRRISVLDERLFLSISVPVQGSGQPAANLMPAEPLTAA